MHYMIRTYQGPFTTPEWEAHAAVAKATQVFNDYTGQKVSIEAVVASDTTTAGFVISFEDISHLDPFMDYWRSFRSNLQAFNLIPVTRIEYNQSQYDNWIANY